METQAFLGLGGARVRVSRGTLEAGLGKEFEGSTLGCGDSDYEQARLVWNAMIDRRPSLIARCSGSSDVQSCVRFAREHGIALTIRGGGHNIGGRAVADEALMVDLSQQRQVNVDGAARIADVAPGALLRDVDRSTLAHELVLPTGIVSETGLAGLTLGGGFGWLARRFGLTCDHLVEAQVVTGRGEFIHAREHEHADLMWALRGGGGGCGIVTNFRFRLHDFVPQVVAGMLVCDSQRTRAAVDHFRGCADAAPEALAMMLKLCSAPPAPFLPSELHGKPVAIVVACHSGDPKQARTDLEPLRGAPAVVADLIQPRHFADFQSMFDAGEPKGRRDYWKSEYVTELDEQTVDVLVASTQAFPSPYANLKVFQLGGAVSRVSATESAAGHRDARFIIVVASAWNDPRDDERNLLWVRETWRRIHELSRRGGYVNFLTEDADADERANALGGVDLDRLASIRRRYDPDGLFAGGL